MCFFIIPDSCEPNLNSAHTHTDQIETANKMLTRMENFVFGYGVPCTSVCMNDVRNDSLDGQRLGRTELAMGRSTTRSQPETNNTNPKRTDCEGDASMRGEKWHLNKILRKATETVEYCWDFQIVISWFIIMFRAMEQIFVRVCVCVRFGVHLHHSVCCHVGRESGGEGG